ncbi:hypothetical protein EON71_00475 [bacterium]|nr:MAG: hypothetical protein EON71_00475 [bacterium]
MIEIENDDTSTIEKSIQNNIPHDSVTRCINARETADGVQNENNSHNNSNTRDNTSSQTQNSISTTNVTDDRDSIRYQSRPINEIHENVVSTTHNEISQSENTNLSSQMRRANGVSDTVNSENSSVDMAQNIRTSSITLQTLPTTGISYLNSPYSTITTNHPSEPSMSDQGYSQNQNGNIVIDEYNNIVPFIIHQNYQPSTNLCPSSTPFHDDSPINDHNFDSGLNSAADNASDNESTESRSRIEDNVNDNVNAFDQSETTEQPNTTNNVDHNNENDFIFLFNDSLLYDMDRVLTYIKKTDVVSDEDKKKIVVCVQRPKNKTHFALIPSTIPCYICKHTSEHTRYVTDMIQRIGNLADIQSNCNTGDNLDCNIWTRLLVTTIGLMNPVDVLMANALKNAKKSKKCYIWPSHVDCGEIRTRFKQRMGICNGFFVLYVSKCQDICKTQKFPMLFAITYNNIDDLIDRRFVSITYIRPQNNYLRMIGHPVPCMQLLNDKTIEKNLKIHISLPNSKNPTQFTLNDLFKPCV